MTDPIRIPSPDSLRDAVVKITPPPILPALPKRATSKSSPSTPPLLTSREEAFLSSATDESRVGWNLEQHWKALDVRSGSVKRVVIKKLEGLGFIHLENKGKGKVVHVYAAGWDYLGKKAPTGEGVGCTTHRLYVKDMKRVFEARGWEVHIEHPIGPDQKRVDLLVLGRLRIGVEVALSSVKQEIHNLQADLDSGALDHVLVASPKREMLHAIRVAARNDEALIARLHTVTFCLLEDTPL